jgi:hypothetical protein
MASDRNTDWGWILYACLIFGLLLLLVVWIVATVVTADPR